MLIAGIIYLGGFLAMFVLLFVAATRQDRNKTEILGEMIWRSAIWPFTVLLLLLLAVVFSRV